MSVHGISQQMDDSKTNTTITYNGTMKSGFYTYGGMSMFVVSLVFQTFAVIAVGLRVYAKFLVRRNYQLHDYLIFAAIIMSLGYFANSLAAGDPGAFGLHVWQADPSLFTRAFKGFFSSMWLWITATALVKLSILSLYTTIFSVPWFRKLAYLISLITCLFWLSYILVIFLNCRPIKKNWYPDAKGHCGSVIGQEIASASINMALDFVITFAPLPVLWHLKMDSKKKLMVTGVIGLGVCICAMNAARVAIEATTIHDPDWTYNEPDIGLFAGLEIYIGIIVACCPLFGPIFFRYKKKHNTKYTGDLSSHPTGSAETEPVLEKPKPSMLRRVSRAFNFRHISSKISSLASTIIPEGTINVEREVRITQNYEEDEAEEEVKNSRFG